MSYPLHQILKHTCTSKLHTLYPINYFQLLPPLLSFLSYTITENFVYEQGKTCLEKMLCISYSSNTTFSTVHYTLERFLGMFLHSRMCQSSRINVSQGLQTCISISESHSSAAYIFYEFILSSIPRTHIC